MPLAAWLKQSPIFIACDRFSMPVSVEKAIPAIQEPP
jgi:hypothetical protein